MLVAQGEASTLSLMIFFSRPSDGPETAGSKDEARLHFRTFPPHHHHLLPFFFPSLFHHHAHHQRFQEGLPHPLQWILRRGLVRPERRWEGRGGCDLFELTSFPSPPFVSLLQLVRSDRYFLQGSFC